MKNKTIAILSAAIITAGTIGGVAFASNMNRNLGSDIQQQVLKVNSEAINVVEGDIRQIEDSQGNIKDLNNNFNPNSANNPSKDIYQDMTKLMRENGFKDAARYMQTGDIEGMNEFMNNMTDEDYEKMIEIMKENGYGPMAQMMESISREDMLEMHNTMSNECGGFGNGNNGMMGGFGFNR